MMWIALGDWMGRMPGIEWVSAASTLCKKSSAESVYNEA